MKQLESADDLKSWELYRQFLKDSLKLIEGEQTAYISKDKLEFEIDGKVWKGHAFLAGKKALPSIQAFKKDGVLFREGTCARKGKELTVGGFKLPKLIKEAEKTFLKLKLGYKIAGAEGAATGGESDSDAGGPDDARDESAWKQIKKELGGDVKQAIEGGAPDKARMVEIVREATGLEKARDFAGATELFLELRSLLAKGGGGSMTPERRKELVTGLSQMEKDIERLMAALK